MNKENELEYRLYGLVPYNISDIQKGIQFGHGVVEYSNIFSDDSNYKKWSQYDKTFIILNGGTTNDIEKDHITNDGSNTYKCYEGTLNNYKSDLIRNNINIASFREPDLQNALTAVVFLVDERVWNTEKYPNFKFNDNEREYIGYQRSYETQYYKWSLKLGNTQKEIEKNLFLRRFLKKFKLA